MTAPEQEPIPAPEPAAPVTAMPPAEPFADPSVRQPGSTEVPLPTIYPAIKRVLEFPVALAMTALLSPILIGVSIASMIAQGSGVFFTFPRMGKNGKTFGIFKFRTMDKHAKQKQAQGVPHHELITPFGHFLRNTHLDEVPQILNVLFGHISFVGPRPIDSNIYEELLQQDKIWPNVLKTRPGITCLESVMADLPELRPRIRKVLGIPQPPAVPPTKSLPRRYPLDMFYIENESLWLDLVIVWYTFRTVTGRAAPHV